MIMQSCQKSHFKRIAIFAVFIFLFAGTLDTIISGRLWYLHYLYSFVITTTCTFFCTVLICSFIEKIRQYPRLVYYVWFTVLVTIGVFLGVVSGTLILEQRLFINKLTLLFSLLIGLVSSVIVTAYMFFRENLETKASKIKQVEIENERLKRYELEARLSSLQAKLNPHFLFNTLNSTAALIYDNKIFAISNHNFIKLKEELALIEDMLELQKLRFDDNLSYSVDCPEALLEQKIPGLLIEPLVENVIKHVHGKTERKIHINIKIKQQGDKLFFRVEDNGAGFEVEKIDVGYGLYSIQQRLRLLFGNSAGFTIDSAPGKGTKVSVWIPV